MADAACGREGARGVSAAPRRPGARVCVDHRERKSLVAVLRLCAGVG